MRRLKADVLPQLPAKRQVVLPVALDNQREYKLAQDDVIAWLREQPLDLGEVEAKIAAALRAERLAQLNALKRLAARGKASAALAWIEDFLASDEPLVVFAGHREVQELLLERFPDALHILGRDSIQQREAAVDAFQDPDGPQLIVCATRVAGQGITLTRASNVAFLDLEWTPAMHDQAEDRCHRIGQHDAVTAWYLLAADTIDETMIELISRKRGIVGAVTDGRRDESEALDAVRRARAARQQAAPAAALRRLSAARKTFARAMNISGQRRLKGHEHLAQAPRPHGPPAPPRPRSTGRRRAPRRHLNHARREGDLAARQLSRTLASAVQDSRGMPASPSGCRQT